MSKQFFIIFTSVALLASGYQIADAATLISSGDCAENREYKELALNYTKKTTKTTKTTKRSKTTARAQTKKVELPSSWDLGYLMMGSYEYCSTDIEVGNASANISLYKNGIVITITPISSDESDNVTLPASCRITVGEDVFTVKNSGYNEYTLEVTDTATIDKIINSISTGDCIIKFDNGQQRIEFPATGEFAKDIKQAYQWAKTNPYGFEL